MVRSKNAAVARMGWDALQARLRSGSGATRGAGSDRALRDYFGAEELAHLRELADHVYLRRAMPRVGNVVLLPGIMGSSLTTTDRDGDEDLIWVSFLRLVLGRIERLKLSPDGATQADPSFTVQAVDVDKGTYARAVLSLQARWNVVTFPYDWRKDLDEAAHGLAALIQARFRDEPVHLVAHSMGGLVCRNFIRLHPDLWEAMRDPHGGRGGRLVMLGTPNYGSFAIMQALTGEESLVRLLGVADLHHDLSELLEILCSFVGSYQLLPAPNRLPPATQALYRAETWADVPISSVHLQRAFRFHGDLEQAGTVDPARMVYVAGCGRETLAGLEVPLGDGFAYTTTYDGDGRVTHALGLLEGVATYYVDETHGDLPRNQQVLAAVDELLESGSTTVLAAHPIPPRAIPREAAHWRRSPEEEAVCREVRAVGERARTDAASAAEIRQAEEQLVAAALGRARPTGAGATTATEGRPQARPLTLRVELIQGDITRVAAPVVVVGHYKGVAPVNAEGAIDAALGHFIGTAESHGLIGAELGELFFIPAGGAGLAAKAVLLAGMGEAGRFGREDLRFVMGNVATAVGALGIDRFATVLIGSGEGNLPRERALRALLFGVGDALHRAPRPQRVTRLVLVERDRAACTELHHFLRELARTQSVSNLTLRVGTRRRVPGRAGPAARGRRRPDVAPMPFEGKRITIERDGDTFRYSALTEQAVVPVRDVGVQAYFARGTAEHLMTAQTRKEQDKYGGLLATYLLPEDFQALIEDGPLTLVLDRSTAAYPWEMARIRGAGGPRYFGTHLRLTRQFRSMLSRPPGVAPALNDRLRVLVIADPAPEPHLRLPGARAEGREVVRVLNTFGGSLDIEIAERIGAADCDPVEILALVLDEEFDVIHFAGHGVVDDSQPDRSGWVFGEGRILSARDIFRARRVPRLVVANACFSAAIKDRPAMSAEEMNRGLAGIAEAFFERGVRNYVGSGWPVDDALAARFAAVLYRQCLEGETLREAVAAGREAILHEGTTWGAYQHYGHGATRLVRRQGTPR